MISGHWPDSLINQGKSWPMSLFWDILTLGLFPEDLDGVAEKAARYMHLVLKRDTELLSYRCISGS